MFSLLRMSQPFANCAMCKKPIPMGAKYFQCSVSTCNAKRTKLHFCGIVCWDAHLPDARHRDAAAIEVVARPDPKR